MRTIAFGFVGLCALILTGCKGSEYNTAPVKGRVTFQGQPAKGGQIFFHPVENNEKPNNNPGKSAFAEIDKEGNYQLSTYGVFDGAVVGRHRVVYASAGGESDEGRPASYLVPEDKAEVEVTSGKNEINIDLVANPAAAGWKPPRKAADN